MAIYGAEIGFGYGPRFGSRFVVEISTQNMDHDLDRDLWWRYRPRIWTVIWIEIYGGDIDSEDGPQFGSRFTVEISTQIVDQVFN